LRYESRCLDGDLKCRFVAETGYFDSWWRPGMLDSLGLDPVRHNYLRKAQLVLQLGVDNESVDGTDCEENMATQVLLGPVNIQEFDVELQPVHWDDQYICDAGKSTSNLKLWQ
jgi:hypothetical protein